MQKAEIEQLVKKYFNDTATSEELDQLSAWYRTTFVEEVEWFATIANEEEILKAMMLENIQKELGIQPNIPTRKLWPRIAAAAAILLVVGAGLLFYNYYTNTLRHSDVGYYPGLAQNDIKPGGNKAYLTLANGKKLSLSDAANGELAKEAGVEITKTADGQIIYTVKGTPHSPQGGSLPGGARDSEGVKYLNALNTIETPKGGQYQVRLPDGTKVWLNAASKLVYPVAFNGREDRRVELSGEAYFEVAKDKQHPFKVKSNGQEVEVLGTHFNINSYADERGTKTTLLEGSVLVSATSSLRGGTTKQPQIGKEVASSLRFPRNDEGGGNTSLPTGISPQSGERGLGTILKPNQQSINNGKTIKVSEADPSEAIAWKNGFFLFNGDDLPTVLRQISRWYDLEIKYEGKIPKRSFDGKIYRSLNLSKALEVLKYSNVKFKLEGRTLIINENN